MDNGQETGSSTEGNPAPDGVTPEGGSEASGNPTAGTVLGEGNGSPPPSETTLGNDDQGFDWAGAGIDADNLAAIEAKGWKTPADAIKGYTELEKKFGEGRLEVPGEEATPEEWDAFYEKTGRPESAEEYKFSMREEIPQDMPYDNTFADMFRNWAHKNGLSVKQADGLHGEFMVHMAQQYKDSFETLDGQVTEAHNELVKQWGAPEEPEFQSRVENATRAMRGLGIEDALKQVGALHESGAVVNAPIALALDRIGSAMFKEDSLFTGASQSTNNPFADGGNMTEQSSLIANDPQRAKHLIRAAGKQLGDFGLAE